jgi:diadenosine tetraphosphatase ApaH/serine/threonine PP2A family protein phosphatase
VYYVFMELFDVLPIAAFLENDIGRFLLVHGGISPELLDLSQINEIDRFVEPPGEGLLCDLLWSDPIDETTGEGLGAQEMLEWDSVDYVPNPDRGCSWVFGYSAISEFVEQLNLVSVIRAHEVQKAGFKEHRFHKQRAHAYMVTVFSAPNYCDMYNNKAAYMLMREDSYEFKQTVHVGHPYNLPNFMDGLTYSLPFVMENLSRFAEDIISICLPKADEHVPEDEQEEVERLRGKILALSRLRHVMGGLDADRRQSIALPKIPEQVQALPKGATPQQIAKFEAALQMDFMKEYLKPGAQVSQHSQKTSPLYRGRAKSLNYADFKKGGGGGGPPRPNFLPPKANTGGTNVFTAKAGSAAPPPKDAGEGNDRDSGRRARAKAVKFGKPPDLSQVATASEAQQDKKEKRRSRDDWSIGK